MRTLGTNLSSAADSKAVAPRYLLEIDHPTQGTLRYATGKDANGSDIVYSGNTYTARDFRIVEFSEIGTADASAVLSFGTNDQVFLALFLNLTQTVAVRIYATTALDGSLSPNPFDNANEVVKLYDGEITGGYQVQPGTIRVATLRDDAFFPPYHVNPDNNFTSLAQAGRYPFPGGTITIKRA